MPISFSNPGIRYSRQSSAPSNPNLGDIWDELSSGNLVEKWMWNGSHWISNIKDWIWSADGNNAATFRFPILDTYIYRLLRWEYTLIPANTWSINNSFSLRYGRGNGLSVIDVKTDNYISGNTNSIFKSAFSFNTDLDSLTTRTDRLFIASNVAGNATYILSGVFKLQLIRR